MENRHFHAYRRFPAEKHPFQIDIDGLPNPRGPHEEHKWRSMGFTIRVDMPGVPQNGLKIIKKPDRITVTFSARAPKKGNFPLDVSERVYAGFVQVNQHPCEVPVINVGKNGCFLLLFPQSEGTLFCLPAPKSAPQISLGSVNSDKGEGSSSGKSIDEAQVVLDQINMDAMNLEGSGKSGSPKNSSHKSTTGSWEARQGECSTSGRSTSPKTSRKSRKSCSPKTSSHKPTKGSAKIKRGEDSSSGKSIHKTRVVKGLEKSEHHEGSSEKSMDKSEASVKPGSGKSSSNESAPGSVKFEQVEGSSAKPIDKPQGSGEARSDNSSPSDADTAWMLAWIKRNVYFLPATKRPKEEPALAETSPAAQSTHEAPEIAIGSIEECSIHSLHCQCECCDSYGLYLKTWSTTEDIIRYVNYLKMTGPEGVCEKQVMLEDGQYSLYVRADLPGLEPHLCVIGVQNSCILVYGRSQSKKNYIGGGRSYLFFVKLRCSCCKFDTHTLQQNFEDGVLRMFSKITRREPGPSAY